MNLRLAATLLVTAAWMPVSMPAWGQEGKATYEASPDQRKIVGADRDFISRTVQRGETQIDIGQLAVQKATTPEIKSLAEKLSGDQTKITEDLRTVAGQKNWTLAGQIQKVDQADYRRLKALSGMQFDRAYLDYVEGRNSKEQADLKSVAENSKDPDVRSFAQRTFAVAQDHGQVIHSTRVTLNGKAKAGQ